MSTYGENKPMDKYNDAKDTNASKYGPVDMDAKWDIIKSYYRNNTLKRLVRHHLESYNQFIKFQLQ